LKQPVIRSTESKNTTSSCPSSVAGYCGGRAHKATEDTILRSFSLQILGLPSIAREQSEKNALLRIKLRRATFAIRISKSFFWDGLPTVAQEDPEGLRRAKVGGGGGSRTLEKPMITSALL